MSNIIFASTKILDAADYPGVGPTFIAESPSRAVQASLVQGASAVVAIEVSLDGTNFIELATITLDADTGVMSDGFVSVAPWRYVRASIRSLGAGAKVNVFVGV